MKTFLKLLLLLSAMSGVAQTPPLEEHTWYLEKLILDGVDHQVPNSFENEFTADFSINFGPEYLLDSPCHAVGGYLTYGNNQTFFLDEATTTLEACPWAPGADEYDELIYNDFILGGNTIINNDFSYAFTNQDNYIVLTLTNANGDQAVYRNQQLSVKESSFRELSLFPNPAEGYFSLGLETAEIQSIALYDLSGKEQKNFEPSERYDIKDLESGVYFVKIIGLRNRQIVKKLIKK